MASLRHFAVVVLIFAVVSFLLLLRDLPSFEEGVSLFHPVSVGSRSVASITAALTHQVLDGGGFVGNVWLQDSINGRTVSATRDIEEGEVILQVPINQTISKHVYNRSMPNAFKKWKPLSLKDRMAYFKETGNLPPTDNMTFHDWERLALTIYIARHARLEGERDHFTAYYQSLPSFDSKHWNRMPLFWTEEQLECLSNSRAGEVMKWQRERIQWLYSFAPKGMTFEDFRWADALVTTRAFNVGIKSHKHTAMIPWADLFNTHETPNMHWSTDHVQKVVNFVAARAIKKGEEIKNSYGLHPNFKLLQTYGFTYPEVPTADFSDQDLFAGRLEFGLEDAEKFHPVPARGEKQEIIEESSKSKPVFRFASFVDGEALWKLLGFARFLTLPDMHPNTWEAAKCSRYTLPAPRCYGATNKKQEDSALRLMLVVLHQPLYAYSTDHETDEKEERDLIRGIQEKRLDENMMWKVDCVRTLRDEKRPFVYSLDFVERAIHLLKHSEIQPRTQHHSFGFREDKATGPTRKPKPDHCVSKIGGPAAGNSFWKCEVDFLVEKYKDEIKFLL